MKSKLMVVLCVAAGMALAVNAAMAEEKQSQAAVEMTQVQFGVPEAREVKALPSRAEREAKLLFEGADLGGMLSLLLGAGMFAGMINYIQSGNAITAAAH